MRILIATLIAVLTMAQANAQAPVIQTWGTLSDQVLFGDLLPGPDYLYGTDDEIPGSNSLGHSTGADFGPSFAAPPDFLYSVWQGITVQRYDPITGNFDILQANAGGTINCATCVPPLLDDPFTAALAPDTNSGTPSGPFMWNYVLNVEVSNGSIYRRQGTSYLRLPGEDPTALFGPEIGAHFSLVATSTVLPADPLLLYFLETFEAISGLDEGLVGNQYGTMVLLDQVVVPLPPAIWLLGSALLAIFARKGATKIRIFPFG